MSFDWSNAVYEATGEPVVLSAIHDFPYYEKYAVVDHPSLGVLTYYLNSSQGYQRHYPKVVKGINVIEDWRL